jgi:capsule biosynthesis phosphatase
MKRLIMDLDGTITSGESGNYSDATPQASVVTKMREYKAMGFELVISTARNMRTYEGNVGKINVHTLPIIIAWLDKHDIPYDEIIVGKPWCGYEGFYVDDKAVRPSEFTQLDKAGIDALLAKEKAQ